MVCYYIWNFISSWSQSFNFKNNCKLFIWRNDDVQWQDFVHCIVAMLKDISLGFAIKSFYFGDHLNWRLLRCGLQTKRSLYHNGSLSFVLFTPHCALSVLRRSVEALIFCLLPFPDQKASSLFDFNDTYRSWKEGLHFFVSDGHFGWIHWKQVLWDTDGLQTAL